MTRLGNLKAWTALVVAAVSAAIVVAIIGVALGGGPAVAVPATDATIEATQFRVGPGGQIGEAFAVCPGTKRAVGGGVVQSGPALLNVRVLASGPLDATGVTLETNDGDRAKQWYAAVYNTTEEQRTFRVFAICSRSSTATIEATQFTALADQYSEAFAVCPGNRRALGGGVVQSGPADRYLHMSASGPLDSTGITAETRSGDVAKQWYAAVTNFSEGEQRTLKVFAICSRDSAARIKATSFTLSSEQIIGEAFARCARTKRLLGGGVVQSGPANRLSVIASGPLDGTGVTRQTKDGDVARQWYAAVVNDTGSAREFKAFAICE